MFCRHCGKEIPPDGRFCYICGKPYLPPRSVPEPDTNPPTAPGQAPAPPPQAPVAAPVREDGPREPAPPAPEAALEAEPEREPEPVEPEPTPEPSPPEEPAPAAPQEEDGTPPSEAPDQAREQPLRQAGKSDGRGLPPIPPPPAPLWQQGGPPLPMPPRKSRLGVVILILVLVILLAVASVVLYFTGALDGLPGRGQPPTQQSGDPAASAAEVVREPGQPVADTPVEREPLPPVSRSGESQPYFPHVSEAYLYAREDGEHIYFLPLANEADTPLHIYRMDRDGANLAAVVTLDYPDSQLSPVAECFTLLGEHIYFGARLSSGRCAYFRVPKEGGETEFLFLQDLSLMVPYGDTLYFLFPRQRAWGRYLPGEHSLPELHDLPDNGRAEVQHQFSVVEGYLYYGEYRDSRSDYYRLDLSDGSVGYLLSSDLLGDYVVRPVWDGETAYYVQYDEEGDRWMRADNYDGEGQQLFRETEDDGQVLFAARVGEFFLFRTDRTITGPPWVSPPT